MQNSPQFVIAYYAILRADSAFCRSARCMSPTNSCILRGFRCVDRAGSHRICIRSSGPARKQAKHAIVATYADYLTEQTSLEMPEFVRAERRASAILARYRGRMRSRRTTNLCLRLPSPTILRQSSTHPATTGKSKGCIHTHRTVMATLVGGALWEGFTTVPSRSRLRLFPRHRHAAQHERASIAGSTIAILPRWNADVAGYMIERYGCTHWANVPTMVVTCLRHPAICGAGSVSLTNIFGAVPRCRSVAQKLYDLCGIDYMEAYGMTETISQTHMNPSHKARSNAWASRPSTRNRWSSIRKH